MIQSNPPLLNEAMAHICDNIFQTSTTCLNILGTQIVMTHDKCIFLVYFCFQMHISEHEPQPLQCPLVPVPTLRSIKTNYASCLFAKYAVMHFVWYIRSACLFVCHCCCLVNRCTVCASMFYVYFICFDFIYVFLLFVYCIFHLRSVSACHCNSLQPYKFDGNIHNVFTSLSADIVNLVLTCMCVYLFRAGVQPPVGRTSPQRMGWWWPCLPVRPVPGLSQPSWPATCWWPTSCWLTYSQLCSSTYTV